MLGLAESSAVGALIPIIYAGSPFGSLLNISVQANAACQLTLFGREGGAGPVSGPSRPADARPSKCFGVDDSQKLKSAGPLLLAAICIIDTVVCSVEILHSFKSKCAEESKKDHFEQV